MDVLSRELRLRFRNFFNIDPGHRIPACVGVSVSITGTIAHPESHAHFAFVNVVAVPLNMADTVNILILSCPHVHKTINWQRSCTFSAIESEIPAFAAVVTRVDSKNASPIDMEGSVREVLGKQTLLKEIETKLRYHTTLMILDKNHE